MKSAVTTLIVEGISRKGVFSRVEVVMVETPYPEAAVVSTANGSRVMMGSCLDVTLVAGVVWATAT